MGPFYVADLQTCEEFGMTMTLTQFYDLAGVPIREIFAILAKEQNVQRPTATPWAPDARNSRTR